jgi:hypothetical protein
MVSKQNALVLPVHQALWDLNSVALVKGTNQ